MNKHSIRFGTDGWRAVIADEFTYANVEIVAGAVARYLLENFSTDKPVVVGYDTRFMADAFAACAAEVLRSHGFSVLLTEGYTPTPLVAFAAKHYDSAGALMFTASHNPPEYCGIKFIPHYAGPATPEITDALMRHINTLVASGEPLRGKARPGTLETFRPMERYLPFLLERIAFDQIRNHPLRILYDPMYGAGQGFLDVVLREQAGCQVEMLHEGLDPRFGGRIPEPKGEYLPELIARVPAEGFDLGLANDGDADRFGIVNERGAFLSANQILPLLLRYLHQHRGYRGSVVRTVATSMLLDCVAKRYDVTVHETPVGFKYVGEWMRREPIIIGGEESGGLSILGHIPEKDGILADLLVVEMMAVEKKPLGQLFDEMLDELGLQLYQLSENLHLTDAQKHGVMAAIRQFKPGELFAGKNIVQVDDRDGVKLMFGPSSWMLVRPSGTEPILRLYGESSEEVDIQRFQEAMEALIQVPQPI